MGGIHFRASQLRGSVDEHVGYKAGLALSTDELIEHAPVEYRDLLVLDADAWLRIRSEEYEDLVLGTLFNLGSRPTRHRPLPFMSLTKEFPTEADQVILQRAVRQWADFHETEVKRLAGVANASIDPTPFVEVFHHEYGLRGARIALALVERLDEAVRDDVWGVHRLVWKNIRELRELFKEEGLATPHGKFFDQRFIDYLDRNFNAIDKIHWRQFEKLVAEHFEKNGFDVDLGPGRNDDGVDIRIWPRTIAGADPALILVQCKRQKAAVEKVIVKSLWADVLHEGAASGLIVTTSRMAPGAIRTRDARSYRVAAADRETLRQWLRAMRTPSTGSFLSE